ncbi:EMI domain-containing protein 1 isoform X10 [Chrysemys picta bellii]|uniref:EMI domain-containing protein 1 isoform X10 n=1 Tax=Chrysemys picta bellii TaxID=8478 RepID=UPI0032B1AF2D
MSTQQLSWMRCLPAALWLCCLLPEGSCTWSLAGLQYAARRNWCSYMVTRTVSCHVQNGTFLQRVFQGCRWPGGCNGGSYRAIVRPAYKVAYKTVTALEWRCCPGHSGVNCEEETISYITPQETGRPSAPLRRLPLRPATYSGCLNCSKVVELTARLNSLEAKGTQEWERRCGVPFPDRMGNQGPKDPQAHRVPREMLGARGHQESLEPRVPLDRQAPRGRQGGMVPGASPERRDFRAFQGPRDLQGRLPQWGLQYHASLIQGTRFCQTPSLNLAALAPWGLRDPQGLQGQWVLWAPQGQSGCQALQGTMVYPERQVLTEPAVPQGRKETEALLALLGAEAWTGNMGSWVQKANRGTKAPGRPSWSSWLEGSPCWKPSSGQNQSRVQAPNPSPLAPPASSGASATGWQPTAAHTSWPRRPRTRASEEGQPPEQESSPQALRPPWVPPLPHIVLDCHMKKRLRSLPRPCSWPV